MSMFQPNDLLYTFIRTFLNLIFDLMSLSGDRTRRFRLFETQVLTIVVRLCSYFICCAMSLLTSDKFVLFFFLSF